MQWIVVDKQTGRVAGVHNHPNAPAVDRTRFDLIESDEAIVGEEPAEDFERDQAGKIVKRQKEPTEASDRKISLNIFRSRVNQIAANRDIPQAVKDAFMELRKLID